FRVTVGEGEAASAVMAGGRKVAPGAGFGRIGRGAKNEPSVVYAIWMFIQKRINQRRAFDVGGFYELFPSRVDWRAGIILGTDECVHGIAPDPQAGGAGDIVGGTLVAAEILGHIGPQGRVPEQI